MKTRVITAIVFYAIFIPLLWLGGISTDWMTAILAGIGISEVFLMRKQVLTSVNFLLALIATLTWTVPMSFFSFLPAQITKYGIYYTIIMLMLAWTVISKNKTSFDDIGVYTVSSLYIGSGFHYLAAIRNGSEGLQTVFYAFLIIWSTDVFAYLIGRKFGKHKLWPVISPNKTWEGSLGAVICAVIVAAIYVYFVPMSGNRLMLVFSAAFLSIVGQIGDLVESAYKRYYGVKDSGKILPGHGGILDRFDSTLFVMPVVALLGLL